MSIQYPALSGKGKTPAVFPVAGLRAGPDDTGRRQRGPLPYLAPASGLGTGCFRTALRLLPQGIAQGIAQGQNLIAQARRLGYGQPAALQKTARNLCTLRLQDAASLCQAKAHLPFVHRIPPAGDKPLGLKVKLAVSMPGVDRDVAQKIAERGHFICHYSNATQGNIEVETQIV